MKPTQLNGLLISDFNIDVLSSYLQNSPQEPLCSVKSIPFGQLHQVLSDEKNPCWKENTDFLLFWCQPGSLFLSLAKLISFPLNDPEDIQIELDRFIEILKNKSSKYRYILVTSFHLPSFYRGLGPIDYKKNGVHYWINKINQTLMDEISSLPNVFILDSNRWLNSAALDAFNSKLWYMSKIPYDLTVFKIAANDIKNTLNALRGETKKIIFIDLDNTLWGGEVGEIGWENIKLGGHDPVGESFADFQRQLKILKDRGILLAITSKNEESVALDAIENHPEMILKKSDFVGWKINWQDKAQNITALLNEINLTASSAVFIDDNPAERDRVKKALPEIFVPDWPDQSFFYAKTLLNLSCFDTIHVENEDKQRTAMYIGEKKRQDLKAHAVSFEDWLKSLHVTLTFEELNKVNLPRAAQLLNKTNQMNLTTRRLSETELFQWSQKENHKVWTVRVKDDIDDSGLTGIMSVQNKENCTRIVDFILSCRVFGRKIEYAMAAKVINFAKNYSESLIAEYLPTAKNQPCLEFLKNSGFKQLDNSLTFSWGTKNPYPYPEALIIKK